ncbi:uncharacterized protein LOC118775644 isoform X2 [Megalops cyprinoides]|uniref:uncharacterized protein LOC118775644 isoform X2 n=1 Tax=Megalops cyprinoides TaxID=118141 RepID=UPI001864B142|nr:uncharacterized protein LOC118775644 isoform X2 [Megalops cyprinoides]
MESTPCCPPLLQVNPAAQYNQEFWDRILHCPSSLQSEGYAAAPAELVVGVAARRHLPGLGRVKGAELGPKSLPTPEELMGRRTARGGRGGGARRGDIMQQRVATVLHHISDLKRRQSSIDQLKTGRSWGFMANSRPEEGDATSTGEEPDTSETGQGISRTLGRRNKTCPASFPPNLLLHNQEMTLGGGKAAVQKLAPGDNPMMSFVIAKADRGSHVAGCSPRLSPKEFWGFGFSAEQ